MGIEPPQKHRLLRDIQRRDAMQNQRTAVVRQREASKN
jgi:hypothetical protein